MTELTLKILYMRYGIDKLRKQLKFKCLIREVKGKINIFKTKSNQIKISIEIISITQ